MARCHEVDFVAGQLQCRSAEGAYMFDPTKTRSVSPNREQWDDFWRALEAAGVWNWSRDYADPGVCDGTQWSLLLKHAGRSLRSEGSNAYPGGEGMDFSRSSSFGQFLSALGQLTGLSELDKGQE